MSDKSAQAGSTPAPQSSMETGVDEGLRAKVAATGYAEPIDAVILSGTHTNPRRLVNGTNKAFLSIAGRPLVRHVADALSGSALIDRIYVVGPAEELAEVLQGLDRVQLVPQEGKLLSNAWAAVRAAEAPYQSLPESVQQERPILFISCDLPLISVGAIDDFVERAARIDSEDEQTHAIVVGVADEAGLKPFYGTAEMPGVVRPLVQMKEGLMRLSNIYVVRPRKLDHSEFLQTSFSLRKAKDWRNVLKLVFSLFGQQGGWAAAWMTLRLQLSAMLAPGQGRWYRSLREGNTMDRVEQGISSVLGGSVRVAVTPYGGLSLDVDDEEDFRLLTDNYAEWIKVNESLDEARAAQPPPADG